MFCIFWDSLVHWVWQLTFIYQVCRYKFSRIFKDLVKFLKNWFNSSGINWLSDITVLSSSARVILSVIFRFSEKNKKFYCHIFLANQKLRLLKNVLRSFLYNLLKKLFCFLYFLNDSGALLKNTRPFVNLIFS